MHVICKESILYLLVDTKGTEYGILRYEDNSLQKGEITTDKNMILENTATGIWKTFSLSVTRKKIFAEMKVNTGSIITIKFSGIKQQFQFKRTGGWKLRFVLLNKDGEEILGLLPQINWIKKGHDFKLQLNEDYNSVCTPSLILHTLHCANCSLHMLNGNMPALINA